MAAALGTGTVSVSAALRAGGFSRSSSVLRRRIRPEGDIGRRVIQHLQAAGCTLEQATRKIAEMYDSTRTTTTRRAVRPTTAAGLLAVADGEAPPLVVSTVVEETDRESQRWAVEQTLKLHGAYPAPPKADPTEPPAGPIVAVQIIVEQVAAPQAGGAPAGLAGGLVIVAEPRNGRSTGGNGHHGPASLQDRRSAWRPGNGHPHGQEGPRG